MGGDHTCGDAVFVALGKHAALPDQPRGGLVVFHSADGGLTWDEKPVGLGTGHDHPTLAVDTSSSTRANWVYVISGKGVRVDDRQRSSVFVARSTDGGRTFAEPVTVVPSNLNLNAEVPIVLSDGTLIASFGDFQRNTDKDARGRGMLDRRREWMLRSTDGGKTFSIPLFASEACAMGWSSLAVDTSSGSFRDRLYFACRENSGQAIAVASSADRGEIWTDPRTVDADSAGTTVTRRDQPALAVNNAGVVALAWIETHRQANAVCQQVRVTASLDGGRTFLPSRRVSDADSCPDAASNGAAYGRWPRGGDYFALAATTDGVFHVLWSDARAKVFQLWTATVVVQPR
jgi:BNR repeat-like domain